MVYVLDACAMLAFLNGENGGDVIADFLKKAKMGEIYLYMSGIQAIEVYYDRIYVKGLEYADQFLASLYESDVKIDHDISRVVIREAGRLKAAYNISLADAVACATAYEMSVPLITADHKELEPVEAAEPIQFYWFR
jgi:predicted nucleic acid-binding protein